MTFPALFDTCSLYGAYLCDLLLGLAENGAFRPLWSEQILEELDRALAERLGPERTARRIEAMRRAFPDAIVTGYQPLVSGMSCDAKDRHVLAAAVRAKAEVLVTFNTKDFPGNSTAAYDVTVVHVDDFLLDQLDLYPGLVIASLHQQVTKYRNPQMTVADLLSLLARSGLPRFAAEAVRHLPPAP